MAVAAPIASSRVAWRAESPSPHHAQGSYSYACSGTLTRLDRISASSAIKSATRHLRQGALGLRQKIADRLRLCRLGLHAGIGVEVTALDHVTDQRLAQRPDERIDRPRGCRRSHRELAGD